MNRGDIKQVIDMLHGMELTDNTDEVVIFNAVNALEALGNKVAEQDETIELLRHNVECLHHARDVIRSECNEQAAVIEKLTAWLGRERCYYLDAGSEIAEEVVEFLLSPTDSKKILADWLDSVLGEPLVNVEFDNALNDAGWAFGEACPEKSALLFNTTKPALKIAIEKWLKCTKLFKKPEILK